MENVNILMVHDGDNAVKGKIKNGITVRDCNYRQILGESFAKEKFLVKADYILLALQEDSLIALVTQRMKHLMVPDEKILIYKYYENNIYDKSLIDVDYYLHSAEQYEGIIIGMSHTKNGIRTECFENKLLKLGVPSIDLYYMKKLIEILAATKRLSHCSYIIIEFPYYFFNWDISKADRKGYERYSLMHYFDEYHHFTDTEALREYVHKMQIMNTIMKEKLLTYCSLDEGDCLAAQRDKTSESHHCIMFNIIKAFYHCMILESKERRSWKRQACEREYGIWQNVHGKTINENKKIWEDIVNLIKKETTSAKIFIAVFPHNPYFISCHSYFVRRMRHIFYKIIEENGGVTVIDHFTYFKGRPFYFLDECHLNDFGAYIYSTYLRRELKKLGFI